MNTIHRIRRLVSVLAASACALLALAMASPALAATMRVPHYGPPASVAPAQVPAQIHTVVLGGMPGWQIALIAAGTAVLADHPGRDRRPGTCRAAAPDRTRPLTHSAAAQQAARPPDDGRAACCSVLMPNQVFGRIVLAPSGS